MHVYVEDRLAGVPANIDPNIKTADGRIHRFDAGLHFHRHVMHVDNFLVVKIEIGGDVPFRDDQRVVFAHRIAIAARITVLPFLNQLIIVEITKQTIFHFSSQVIRSGL